MIRLAALSAGLLLTGCGEPASEPPPPPSPLMYELASADGTVEGWLFGTIHALPEGTEWRTPAIDRAIDEADVLVVEVASLDDRASASALFSARAAAPDGGDVLERVPASVRPALAGLADHGRVELDDLRATDTWAVALTLAAGVRYGDADNGVDRALLRQFSDRRVVELEGMAAQLELFDSLPEREQRDMLVAVVHDYQRWGDDPAHLVRAWLAGDIEQAVDPRQSALLADPELRETLLDGRNRVWVPIIDTLLKESGPVLVAVGAGHIPGPDGLVTLLEQRGYTLRALR